MTNFDYDKDAREFYATILANTQFRMGLLKKVKINKEMWGELIDICEDFSQKINNYTEKYRPKNWILNDKPFRWGGINHDFDKKAKDWRGDNIKDDVYNECFCCHEETPQDEPLYCATFEDTLSPSQQKFAFRILCRNCAYKYGVGVIEKNGKTYMKYEDFEKEIKEDAFSNKK